MIRPMFTAWLALSLAAPPGAGAADQTSAPSPADPPPVQRPQAPANDRQAPTAAADEPAASDGPTPASPTVSPPPVQRPSVPGEATSPSELPPPAPPVRLVEPPPPTPTPPVERVSLPPADPTAAAIDPVSQAQRAETTRRLVRARTFMAVGGVSLATGLMMVLGAGIEAAKRPCDFEEACEDPPRPEIVRGLAAGGGVLTALGAVAVGFSVPAARRARLELDASRTQARVRLRVRF